MRIKDAPYSSAFILGIAQGIATMPGLSRSGTTIATGLMLGYNKKLAVKYSFIMSIPAILGAVVVKIGSFKSEAFGSGHNRCRSYGIFQHQIYVKVNKDQEIFWFCNILRSSGNCRDSIFNSKEITGGGHGCQH